MNGDTGWKVHITNLRFGQTTRIWNILGLPGSSTEGRPDGHYSCLVLTMNYIIDQVIAWASLMHFQEGLIMELVERTMTTWYFSNLSYLPFVHWKGWRQWVKRQVCCRQCGGVIRQDCRRMRWQQQQRNWC